MSVEMQKGAIEQLGHAVRTWYETPLEDQREEDVLAKAYFERMAVDAGVSRREILTVILENTPDDKKQDVFYSYTESLRGMSLEDAIQVRDQYGLVDVKKVVQTNDDNNWENDVEDFLDDGLPYRGL